MRLPRPLPPRTWLALPVALCLGLAGCADDDDDGDDGDDGGAGDEGAAFTLQLLHAADFDGATGALDNVEPFSALLDAFRAERPDETLVLSSGDNYIPGPRFFAAEDESLAPLLGVPGPGRADIAFLNAMGFAASAVGNHDLDTGTAGFAGIIGPDDGADEDGSLAAAPYPGASFPYLSSNLDFSTDEALAPLVVAPGQPASAIPGSLSASTTVEVNGETIGVVGATTPQLASITSTGTVTVLPEDGDDLDALAAEIQPAIDALVADGVDKIVLLSHMQQIAIEQALATRLDGVDVIVAGGSNTILADADDALRPGDEAVDDYPLEYESASGEPVLLVNTDGDYRYLGRLVVGFDEAGVVLVDTLDESVNGAYAATSDAAAAAGSMPIPEVASIATALRDVLAERDGNIVGRTGVYLDGRRSEVRTEETNLGNLTADANLWLARQADPSVAVSLKNGGGIRSDIGLVVQPAGSNDPDDVTFLPPPANEAAGKAEGDISEFDLQGALRFNNGLTLLTLTAAELVEVLEHGVAATEDGATPGQFPQVGGLAFAFDPALPAREGGDASGEAEVEGMRVRSAELVGDGGETADVLVEDGRIVGDPTRPIRIVILDFIAKCVGVEDEECGDGYPLQGLANPDRVDLVDAGVDPGLAGFADPGSEQDALAEYLATFFVDAPFDEPETPPAEDARIRNLTAGAGTTSAP